MTLRIAFVMSGLGIVERGAEAFVVELAEALRERGVAVTTFGRGTPPVPDRQLWAVPRDAPWLTRLYRFRWLRKVLDTLWLDPLNVEWATASWSAQGPLRRGDFDVLVMEGGLIGAAIARRLRRRRGTAFVDIAHGNSPKWERAFARQGPDRVVAFTGAAAEMIAAGAPQAAIEVIPHGVDLDRFHPGAPPAPCELPAPVVMTAGALDDHKRIDRAIAAVAELHRRGRRTSLLVLGRGPLAEPLDELAHRLLGRQHYRRLAVPRAEMPGWFTVADVLTLPSISEAFGLAYLEALACGLPCVAPDDAVRREVLGEVGLYADPEDTAAYADALAAALDRDWQNLPRQRAEAFSAQATIDAYQRLFETLAAERRSGSPP
ncbi:MAG: glycosyltransferase [Acidobacteriota bacterium]